MIRVLISALIPVIPLLIPAESLLSSQYQRQFGMTNKEMPFQTKKHSSSNNNNNLQMRLNPTSFKGTDYTITEFPRPSLRRVPNSPIVQFDDQFEVKAQEMLGMMYEAKGVGLAAPQVGLNEDFFVYNAFDKKELYRIVCNPTISQYSKEVEVEQEGCLSLRSDYCAGQVSRSVWIETEYQNELGQKVRRRLKGFEARVFQHEYDHLKGILCYDRFPPEDREGAQKSIDYLLGLYSDDDALVEPDTAAVKDMQPRPMSAKWMPPLESADMEQEQEDDSPFSKKQKVAKKPSGGFGAGAGMGNKKTSGGNKEEKEAKKKVKTRNALRSSNPKFKSTRKTAFANRK